MQYIVISFERMRPISARIAKMPTMKRSFKLNLETFNEIITEEESGTQYEYLQRVVL